MKSLFFDENGDAKQPTNINKTELMESVFETLDRNFDVMPEQFIIDDCLYPVSLDDINLQKIILKTMMDEFIKKEEFIKCNRLIEIEKKMQIDLNL